jgi:putative DNA primase/helicase
MAKSAIVEILEEYPYGAKDSDALLRKIKVRRADGTVEKVWQRFDEDKGDWINGYRYKGGGKNRVETGLEPDWFTAEQLREAVARPSDGFLNPQAEHIYVLDGEKDVLRAWREGRAATCSPHGMGHFPKDLAGFLVESGRVLVVVPDQDGGEGDKQAAKAKARIEEAGGRVVLMYPRAGAKDLTDHFEQGGSWDTLTEEKPGPSASRSWVERYVARAKADGHRNEVGFDLACQLRDLGMSRDAVVDAMTEYQEAVEHDGDPPYEHSEMVDTVNSVFGRAKRNAPGTPPGGEKGAVHVGGEFPWSDLGNGRRLVQAHGERLRYVHAWKRWLVWDGTRWIISEGDEVIRLMNDVLEGMALEAAGITDEERREQFRKFVTRSQGINARRNALASASVEEGVPVLLDELDADPWLLNVRNGTLDLRTGELLAHDPKRLITKLAPVEWDPKAKCPTFGAFIKRAFADDEEMLAWLNQIVGYSLTGSVQEKAYFTLLGQTDAGKTVFVKTMQRLLGSDYAQQLESSELMMRRLGGGGHNEGIADLKGKRFASISEPATGAKLDVAAIKHITGGGRVRASRKHEHAFEFQPEAKIFIDTNHDVGISDTDDSIWNRTTVVEFNVQIPLEEQDQDLETKLAMELAGILRWAVAGCLAWQRAGKLSKPAKAVEAEARYREDQDPLGDFFDECCVFGPDREEYGKTLRTRYVDWCEENKIRFILSDQAWHAALKARGCVRIRRRIVDGKQTKVWTGVGLNVNG